MPITITVTDKMLEAGKKALSEHDSGFWSRGGVAEEVLLKSIYEAMATTKRTSSMLAAFFPE